MILTHEPAPVPAPAAASASPAILIVDDAPANLGVLRTMMSQQGYQTFVATSGERAISIAQRVQPDLILLDVVMPGMDGFETCRQLKQHPRHPAHPGHLHERQSETDDIVAGFDIGAADYIGKPLRMAEVCARVRAQLQMRSTSEAQKEQADRLRMIVNAMDEGLMIIEAERPHPVQQSGLRTLPRLRPERTGRPCAARAAGRAAGAGIPRLLRRLRRRPGRGHQAGAREVMIRHRDGALRAMDLTLTPMSPASRCSSACCTTSPTTSSPRPRCSTPRWSTR